MGGLSIPPAAPAFFISIVILGRKPVKPDYAEYLVAPHLTRLQWARGTTPTVNGPIDVSWRREGQSAAGPAGFEIHRHNPSCKIARAVPPKQQGRDPPWT